MYSHSKALLEQQQTRPPTDAAITQIKEILKPEQATILASLIDKLNPLIESRNKETLVKAQLTHEITTLASELIDVTNLLQRIADKLESFENLKSENAEQERIVLNKLLEVL